MTNFLKWHYNWIKIRKSIHSHFQTALTSFWLFWTSTSLRHFLLYKHWQKVVIFERPSIKVHIFWEGHKILQNLHRGFILCSKILWPSQNMWTLTFFVDISWFYKIATTEWILLHFANLTYLYNQHLCTNYTVKTIHICQSITKVKSLMWLLNAWACTGVVIWNTWVYIS